MSRATMSLETGVQSLAFLDSQTQRHLFWRNTRQWWSRWPRRWTFYRQRIKCSWATCYQRWAADDPPAGGPGGPTYDPGFRRSTVDPTDVGPAGGLYVAADVRGHTPQKATLNRSALEYVPEFSSYVSWFGWVLQLKCSTQTKIKCVNCTLSVS